MTRPVTAYLLNHGYVQFVDKMGDDLSISRAARCSNNPDGIPVEWREFEDPKLLRYLWRNNHTTPFEAVTMTFQVKAPIFVFRQWHRHRTWTYNELSARYQELPEEFYLPTPELVGYQSKDLKQGRSLGDNQVWASRCADIERYRKHMHASFELYHQALQDGWPRELARIILPMGTYSIMQCTVNLLNLFRFVKLRSDSHAQYEIRVYSDAMLEMVRAFCPLAVQAFELSNKD